MTKEVLIHEIKQRMNAIYLAMDVQVADDLHRIFKETLKHLENKRIEELEDQIEKTNNKQ